MGQSVLLIDDNKDGRTILRDLFASAGFVPITAKNGLAGLKKLREAVPCLIVLDLRMPEMDGWQFEKKIRSHPALVRIPLIVVTACQPEEIGDLRADAVFQKPYQPDSLLATAQELITEGPRRLTLIKKR